MSDRERECRDGDAALLVLIMPETEAFQLREERQEIQSW